jgi:hypothetical protein
LPSPHLIFFFHPCLQVVQPAHRLRHPTSGAHPPVGPTQGAGPGARVPGGQCTRR